MSLYYSIDFTMSNHEVIKLKRKLKKYNEIIKTLAKEEELDSSSNSNNNKSVYKSVIIENHVDCGVGSKTKVLPSELGDSFLVIDETRDLDELNKSEQNAIHAQDYLSKADKTKKYFRRINNSYGWVCTVLGVSRLLVALVI